MIRSTTIVGSMLVAALSGCSGRDDVALVEVLNHDQCRISQAGVEVVSIGDVATIRGSRLLSMPDEPDNTPTDLLLVAVSRGQQPTPGYGFELLEGSLKGDAVTVRLGWNRPAADAVLAQVITHPCIVIGLEGEGFGTLRVLDEEGALLGEIVLAGG